MSSDLSVEAKEIIDTFVEKDFKAWLSEELRKTADKTNKIAQIIIQIQWEAPTWEITCYNQNEQSQSLIQKTGSYKINLDMTSDNEENVAKLLEKNLENIKFYMHFLSYAESFDMTITATALRSPSFLYDLFISSDRTISSKEWTYQRTHGRN